MKHNADGSVERFKVHLVAQVYMYSQSQGVDYWEIFSPLVHYNSVRSLLAIANICDWEIHQVDVKTPFLQGDIDEEIYIKHPDGYVDRERSNHVCKLKKSIYGLKQAAHCWNFVIDSFLKSNGFQNYRADPCLYTKSVRQKNGKIYFIILSLYVDDILLFPNNIDILKKEKMSFAGRFKVVDQGEVHYVLGLSVKQDC